MTRKYTCEDLEQRIRTLEAELDNAKRTVEALRESEAKYKKLSDKSPGVVYQFMMAPDGTYSFPYINESLRAVTGISPDEAMRDASVLVGKIHPEDIDRFHKGVLESANSLTPYQGVFRFFIDERQIWIEARSTPERMPDGSILWSGFFLDITERKLERDSLKRTQFAMDKAPDSILWVDDEGGIVYANETACTSMGYTRDELQTMKVFDIDPDVPPDQFDRHKEDLRRQGTMTFESRHRTKYGDIFPVEVSTKHFEYEDRWIACAFDRDITARKQAEETVQKLSRMQSLILNNSTVGISFVRNRIIEWVNPRMPELFGIPQEQFKGASTRILFLNDALYERLGAENYPLLAQGKKASLETVMRKGDGSTFWCRLEGRALDASRPHDGSIWIWEDITARKDAEEALEKRILALTRPLDDAAGIAFEDLFNIDDIQRLQDEFAQATGVASIITRTDGTPLTSPSNFCRLCTDIIRQTEKGLANCYRNDSVIGQASTQGPAIQPCLSGGLWDAGAVISVGGRHIANWLIGQVRDETQTEEKMRQYAREIGADEKSLIEAFREVPVMSREQFERVAQALYTLANQLSNFAYQNVQQARFITERRQAEEALRESEIRHRSILENTGTTMLIIEEDMTISFANAECEKLTGYRRQDVVGVKKWTEFVDRSDLERMINQHRLRRTADANLAERSYEFRLVHRDGCLRDIYLIADMIPGTKQSVTSLIDITDRKRAEEELRESRRRLEDIIEFLPDATMVIDKEGRPIAWNRAMETMTGVKKEDMLGKGDYEYALPFYGERRPVLIDFALHPNLETEKQYTALQRAGDTVFGEAYTPTLPSGNVNLSGMASVLRDSRGQVVGAIECLRDNTERKRLEERLGRAEKMEVLGTLAGGVAHDLNNMLGLVVGYSELLAEKLTDNSALKKYADNIYQSSIRGAAIIQDLLTLTGRGVTVSEVIDLNRVVVDCLRTQEFEKLKFYQPGVKILTDFEDGLLNIQGSPIHLAKTIMNLVLNATEFISGQGEVTIRTENRYLDQSIQGYDDIREGDYVVLTVSDTGRGISANDLGRIFEPFYTRKVMGISATGLELAVVWGTVKDHNGYIDVQSGEGKGTTFTLYFPATREKPEKVEKTAPSDSYGSKGDSIPVVDDLKE